MKKIAWSLKILIPILILTGVVISFAGVPRWFHPLKPQPVVSAAVESGVTYTEEDENVLRELMSVYAHMDSCKEIYATGAMDAFDPADSSATLHNPFVFSRRGNELYYQMGDMEMVALKEIYIAISNKAKKIFVGPPRKVLAPFQLPADSMVNIWKSENYTVSGETTDDRTRVRLLCGNHVTCKEYRFDYDSAAMVLKGTYMRLTNLDDPLNTAMDKVVSVAVDQWREKNIPASLFRPESYLVKGPSGWLPAKSYTGYTLISLY